MLRRRRQVAGLLVLLLAAALIAGGMWLASLFGAAGGSSPGAAVPTSGPTEASAAPGAATPASPGASANPSAPASPGTTAAPSASSTSGCDESLIVVSGSTDAASYGPGTIPVLIMTVTNKGPLACEVNVGTSQMEFTVTSGADRIFSSKDCQVDAQDTVLTIEPGQSKDARFSWERNRSAPGCAPVAAQPGLGYYVMVVKLGDRSSNKTVFQLV